MKLTIAIVLLLLINAINCFIHNPINRKINRIDIKIFNSPDENSVNNAVTPEAPLIPENETPEEKYKREKLAEIAERKAAEVFITRNTGKFECQACGYIYDEAVGLPKKGILPGTTFADIDKFRCPQCGVGKNYFVAETETLSGFKENQKYGLGGNSMTGGQKSNIIFGGLAVFFALFMSGYLLE